jgi:hypothetical protein
MDPRRIMMLVEDYNATPDKYTNQEAEMIAALAASAGQEFRRESKPFRKLAFNLADTASFGLLPDSVFKPSSRGETVYGETMIDKIASGTGALGGLFAGGAALVKGGLGAARYLKEPVMGVKGMTRGQQMVGQARDVAAKSPLLHSMRYYAGRGKQAVAGTAAAQSTSKGFNKLVKNMSERLLISEENARNILLGSGALVGAGMYFE